MEEEQNISGVMEPVEMPMELPPEIPESPRKKQPGGRDLLIGIPIVWAVEIALGVLLAAWIGQSMELEKHPVPLLVVTLISGAVTLLVSWWLMCRKYGKTFTEGFRITRPTRKTVGMSLLITLIMVPLLQLLDHLFSLSTGEHLFIKLLETTQGTTVLLILFVTLPFVEEFYYRGFIYPILEKKLGGVPAALIVILWFTVIHIPQANGDYLAIPIIMIMGTIFTLQRAVTGSLTASLITHWIYNAILAVITLAASLLGN
jgi:membrane protease YdiL (CAAX protease family)